MGNDCMGGQSTFRCHRCALVINYQGLCPRCRLQPQQPKNNWNQNINQPTFIPATSGPVLSIPRQYVAHPQGDGLYRINQVFQKKDQFINEKIPLNKDMTHFKYQKRTSWFYPRQISDMRVDVMRTRTFQQKLLWFRLNVQKIRVPWHKGANQLRIDRGNLIRSSIDSLNKRHMNFRMQMKIIFEGQQVLDAGGVQRQWMHLILKQIFNQDHDVLTLCDTQQTAYKFKSDKSNNKPKMLQLSWLLGVVLGKAIFDRISINCYLNRTILRQLSNQPVYLNDFFHFDQKLYESYLTILKTDKAQDLGLDFCIYKTNQDQSLQVVQLCTNAANTMLTDTNKQLYVKSAIDYYTNKSIKQYVDKIKEGLYKVVPVEMLMIFQPHQLQALINGPPHIDTKDWQEHTIYKGYSPNSQVVKWYWKCVHEMDQNQLQNLLHYCTGTTRVPVLGFKYLQSNRNQIAKFTISRIDYDPVTPFPKSHTCFNRIQLPNYPSYDILKQNITIIGNEEFNYFGME